MVLNMKRILLVTWYENNNYGTALQAYALKSIIENPAITELPLEFITQNSLCDILPHRPERQRKNNTLKKMFSLHLYSSKIQQLRDKIIYKKKKNLFNQRERAFRTFLKQNFSFAESHNVQTISELQQVGKKYDVIVAGSDQIWNPEAIDPTYLLGWAEAGKKFSYGSSLSVKLIPTEYESLFRSKLKDFKAISIRDRMCRAQLSDIVGKNVSVVVDPVILLGRKGLLDKAKNVLSTPYIFCYFLGNNSKHRELAISISSQLNLPIRAVINAGSDYKADNVLERYADWDVDPWKFVGYINNSSLVVTDSFHATVISVLCHTDFVVLEKDSSRPEQNNRILEFLDSVGLRERWCCSMSQNEKISEKKWEYVDQRLENMRKYSLKFLLEALE